MHRIDRAIVAFDGHANAGTVARLILGRINGNALVVVLEQGVAIELEQAAFEVFLKRLHLLRRGFARVLDGHDALGNALGIHDRPDDSVQRRIKVLRILLYFSLLADRSASIRFVVS